jgi:hypothetical protein
MAKDRVQPLKLEDPGTGGVETDFGPTSTDPSEDYLDAHGMTIQNTTSDDDEVWIGRSDVTDDMLFADKVAGGPYTLTELLAASTFDPGILIITTWGGLVYNSQGILVVKRHP